MPIMDGVGTFSRIKTIIPEAVVVMMTAYRQDMADMAEQALNMGAYACLYKPLDIEMVLRLVEEIWQRKLETRSVK